MFERFAAPAKINLRLQILGINAQGYHLLDTSFAFVDLYDWLEICESKTLSITCSNPSLSGENNLVFQVLQALQKKYHVTQGLSIHIEKHIPMQAGLGGGSSDAATALIAANQFWGLGLSRQSLMTFSAPFGADIPCFLFGLPSHATGIGDHLEERQETLVGKDILLAWPGVGLATEAVFSHFDQQQYLTQQNCLAKMRALESNRSYFGRNDLQSSACLLCSELDVMLKKMLQHCKQSWMSGSGSACVALLDFEQEEAQLKEALGHQKNIWLHIASILDAHPLNNIGT